MAPEKAKQVIEEQLGKSIDDVFAWIDLEAPLGSASIAQVRLVCICLVFPCVVCCQRLGLIHSASSSRSLCITMPACCFR